jgi:hypothetical protein
MVYIVTIGLKGVKYGKKKLVTLEIEPSLKLNLKGSEYLSV